MNLKKLKPFFIPSLVVLVFVLSIIGYKHHLHGDFHFWRVIYATIASFLMHHVDPTIDHGVEVLLAQYLAAVLLGLGLFSLVYHHIVAAYVSAKVKWTYKNHIVVFHLNNIGRNIALELLAKGNKVLVIEHDEANPFIEDVKHAGGIVLHHLPSEAATLDKVNMGNARICILANDNDEENIELASHIARYRYEHHDTEKGSLKIMAHVNNWDNVNVIKDFFDLSNEDEHYDLETFNIHQLAAQKIYDLYPPHKYIAAESAEEQGNSIAIIGYNKTAESFIIENLILSHYPGLKNLKIYLVDKDADTHYHELGYKFPFYNEYAEVIPVKLLNGSFFANYTWSKKNIEQLSKIKVAYFFGDNDAALLNTVTSFRQFLYTQTLNIAAVPLVVSLPEDTGILDLLNHAQHKKTEANNIFSNKLNIHYFRQITDTCKSEMIEETETNDKLSKVINYFYSIKYDFASVLGSKYNITDATAVVNALEQEMIKLTDTIPNLSLDAIEQAVLEKLSSLIHRPVKELKKDFSINKRWHILTHRKKDSNRYAARHAAVKIASLKHIGCWPLNTENIRTFYPRIAPIEHKRWSAEKMTFNFKYGPLNGSGHRQVLKEMLKIHDQIIPYDKLDEVEKDKDLNIFLLMPLLNNLKPVTEEA